MNIPDREDLEIDLLVQAMLSCRGHDFSHYSRASLKRRVLHFLGMNGLATIADLIPRVIHDASFFASLLSGISVNVTEMFRDPLVYLFFRKHVVPVLRTYPVINVWHAGCATGEEVYSSAIVLAEEGLLERSRIYATDIDDQSLEKAREGIFPIRNMKDYTRNYQLAGGRGSLSDFYHSRYDCVIMDASLNRHMVFSKHNLVSDSAFGEMQCVLCRNVLIYFDEVLQNRALSLFAEALAPRGFLCLGTKESLAFSTVRDRFAVLDDPCKWFRFERS